MLADPEWALPLVAGQVQYRGTYYGMTAAALLEDLWYDGLANWVARNEPALSLLKPQRGAPGDYEVDGLAYSHKTGDGAGQTGIHWDALVAQGSSGTWTSPSPMVYVASGNGNLEGTWTESGPTPWSGKCRAVWPEPGTMPPRGKSPVLMRWDLSDGAEVIETYSAWPSFDEVWTTIAAQTASGTPANELEMFWVRAADGFKAGDKGELAWNGRPGVYVFPCDLLQNIPTGSNNRATTLNRNTILGLMESAKSLGLWSPLPMWAATFAAPRPPDLYLAQRSEFDRRFSPASAP